MCVVCVSVCVYEGSVSRGQKKVRDALEVKLQAVVSYAVWVLGTKLVLQEEQDMLLNA